MTEPGLVLRPLDEDERPELPESLSRHHKRQRRRDRLYEQRGMRLRAVHPGAPDRARRLKPQIPEWGENGIRISDEYEFESDL